MITVLFSTPFLPIHCVKPSFGTPSSEIKLSFSPFSSLSKYPFHFPMILSRSLKTARCLSFIRLFLVKSLAFAFKYIFLSPSGVSSSSYNSFFARASAVLLFSLPPCLPACIYLPSWYFPHLTCLFLSLYHLLHLIIPPPCLIISWGSPPCCNAQHFVSYSQNRRAPLLPPSCTLSTGLTFSNTVSLNLIL